MSKQVLGGIIARRLPSVPIGVAISLLLVSTSIRSDARQAADPFAPVSFMLGRWDSTIEGQPGKGRASRVQPRAEQSFHQDRESQRVPAAGKKPKGEVHDDEGFFSFDRARQRLVLPGRVRGGL